MWKSKPKRPFFSIIITTYNRAELLKRALNSLVSQSEVNWEAIIIDDGSTDHTQTIVNSFLKDKRLHYYRQKNTGFIGAKNKGIELAEGEYITFLDSDDEYKRNHLRHRKMYLVSHPRVDFLRGGVKIIGEEYVPDVYNPGKEIHLSKCAIAGTFFLKREVLDKLEGFQGEPLSTDADFLSRAEKEDFKIVEVDVPSYIYHRDTESSVTLDIMKAKKVK